MPTLSSLFAVLIDSLFPKRCIGCRAEGTTICLRCLDRLPQNRRNGTIDKDIASLYSYRTPVMRRALWLLKYQRHRYIADYFGVRLHEYLVEEMADRATLEHFTRPLVVPIPITTTRRFARGFNQAERLARSIVQKDTEHLFEYAVALKKIRNTAPQAHIKDRSARLENLRGAFAVTHPDIVRGRNIVIVDDIATTGATIAEAKRALKKAGAKKIIAVTVAH